MALSNLQKGKIKSLLENMIARKIETYKRETTYMPFLARLIQDEGKIVTYSFIQSLATSLGMSIYEEASRIVAEPFSEETGVRVNMGGTISPAQRKAIANIIRQLRNGEREVNKDKEIREILAASPEGGSAQKEGRRADFYMKRNKIEYYFEIKTVKPNIDIFTATKKKLLEWIARKRRPIETLGAFPYNPYFPKPYRRFTEQGVLQHGRELLINKEYWDFLGGENTYEDVINVFDEVGKKYKNVIGDMIKARRAG